MTTMQKKMTLKNYANMLPIEPYQQAQIKGGCHCSEEKRRAVKIRKRLYKEKHNLQIDVEDMIVEETTV